ncbi:MAG: N-acetylneuraminate synthase [Candidatus Yanofskybacteria bacterium RIFCSPHIGHO2_02_FULL_41_29]|uniref:N-acetylneuraminate synthase n=1 Tax=Candidatus Yanofskybacteria bacterium RIFCSPHIGHO2_01_FULL_41_53 TaxID=1802663 RepID=A0A1F8ELC5_9BACT|nr:MAG: N-acetylneuraminate synthase [Candidatus Yanofskybacteria bacterium RIFCSPHIGHO2_01_FULL_41_53]OGN10306.1 MAG: N-acetylneuraminate synthase [Candidatus Yanofskybacteria bacterium RIFCSPHIGHO2_02_FULL_41_29]OGN16715.1 MAG: N-acetylneuraminate synthase [Candidatus Yanofskybacteria bacterium RIFCSPHIGHO2_12_FULL_41_9]OGN21831.1 MAG: N-acetylneuraminate synthase [Candidatus Yanofskybacteria bacterium RIFCSPLOWO2_01_FULL_41_67]OGN30411.1 MAG: N-acetylneuraminate synthase [Candidatus Yanofsky
MLTVRIGNKLVGLGQPCFIICEIGINHNGSLELAKKLIDMAVAAGCDAVKFQKRTIDVVYTPEELAKPRENPFGPTNGDLKRGLEFGKKEYDEIDRYCRERSMLWFASPWDEASVDFLEQYNPPCYKIASPCNQDKELMLYIKSKGRPIIVSVGMTDDETIEKIVSLLGEDGLIIMHCTSTYPAKDSDLHLANIPRLIQKYPKAIIGYSGHEVGAYPPLIAATLEAQVIERHLTLDRAMWGSDQAASLEMGGLLKLTKEVRLLPIYLGESVKTVLESEKPIEAKLRRKRTL